MFKLFDFLFIKYEMIGTVISVDSYRIAVLIVHANNKHSV